MRWWTRTGDEGRLVALESAVTRPCQARSEREFDGRKLPVEELSFTVE
jgi:hypothetical protein